MKYLLSILGIISIGCLLPAVAELKLIAAANAEAMLTVQLKVTLPSKSFQKDLSRLADEFKKA